MCCPRTPFRLPEKVQAAFSRAGRVARIRRRRLPRRQTDGAAGRTACPPPPQKDAAPLSDDLENQTRFVWDGSHFLQEIHSDGRYTYIYTGSDSYEPLAQVRDWTNEDGENRQQTHYFHCDQIGIPREMTDKDGNFLWFGNYTGWGRLKEETKVTDNALTNLSAYRTSTLTVRQPA